MSAETGLSDTIQVVTFTITEKSSKKGNYAVPIEQVKEIKTVDTITKVPKSKNYVKGVMNLRGKIIPIIDVNEKIGLLDANTINTSKQRILVADVNNALTGLLVDEVNEVLRIPSKNIEIVPMEAFENSNYIKGVAKLDDKLLVLLDISKFLDSNTDEIEDVETVLQSESTENITTETIAKTSTKNNDEGILPEIEEIINQEIQT
ncbi:MAG: chemotaxis protein CheW [Nitrosopumilus sp.]